MQRERGESVVRAEDRFSDARKTAEAQRAFGRLAELVDRREAEIAADPARFIDMLDRRCSALAEVLRRVEGVLQGPPVVMLPEGGPIVPGPDPVTVQRMVAAEALRVLRDSREELLK